MIFNNKQYNDIIRWNRYLILNNHPPARPQPSEKVGLEIWTIFSRSVELRSSLSSEIWPQTFFYQENEEFLPYQTRWNPRSDRLISFGNKRDEIWSVILTTRCRKSLYYAKMSVSLFLCIMKFCVINYCFLKIKKKNSAFLCDRFFSHQVW